MKLLVSVLSPVLFASLITSSAAAKVKCLGFAEKKAAQYLRMKLADFQASHQLIFACRDRHQPQHETIQFGDGSGLVGVEIEIRYGRCVAVEVYAGQDDQDGGGLDDQGFCGP